MLSLKKPSAFLALTLLCLYHISCNRYDWKEYTHMRGDFKVDFKGIPEIQNLKDTFDTYIMDFVSVGGMDEKGISYSVEYKDLPEELINSDTTKGLHFLFANSMKNIQDELGKESLQSFEQISLNKYPGREIIWHNKEKNQGVHQRVYLVNNRFYSVMVFYSYKDREDPDINRFLESFQLISKKESRNEEQKILKTEKNYSIKFPGNTIITNIPSYLPDFGNIVEKVQYYEPTIQQFEQTKESNYLYAVSQIKLPEDIDINKKAKDLVIAVFNGAVERIIQGKVIHYREIDYNGKYWGIEGQGTSELNNVAVHIRAYTTESNVYILYVIMPKGNQNNQKSMDFFDSFKI